jgi:hypothetical protein
MLVQVIGQPVHRAAAGGARLPAGRLVIAVPGTGPGRAGPAWAGADAGQRPAHALARDGGVGQGLLQPVLAQGIPLGVGQVPGRGGFQERARQADPHAQAAGIHRRADQRGGSGRRVPVPGQQLRCPGQELDHLPVPRCCGCQGQPGVSGLGELAHLLCGERGGHADVAAGQQLPRLRMRVGAAARAAGQGVPVLGPQRGQHQHRGTARVAQQLPQPGGNPLAQPPAGHVEVELGLIQPHHGPRPDARQLPQRRIGPGRVDRMPQPPRPGLVPQQPQRLPAGPGFARRGPAHQHRDPATAAGRRSHHLSKRGVVLASHVGRQLRQAGLQIAGLDRPVHLQGKRVTHLSQRPPGNRYGTAWPGQHVPDLAGQAVDLVLDPLALQMGLILVQLIGQRRQRPATRSAKHNLTDQMTGQPVCQHTGRQPQDIRRGLPGAGQARIIEDSQLPRDPRPQRLQQRRPPGPAAPLPAAHRRPG